MAWQPEQLRHHQRDDQRCLFYLHAISLVAVEDDLAAARRARTSAGPARCCALGRGRDEGTETHRQLESAGILPAQRWHSRGVAFSAAIYTCGPKPAEQGQKVSGQSQPLASMELDRQEQRNHQNNPFTTSSSGGGGGSCPRLETF